MTYVTIAALATVGIVIPHVAGLRNAEPTAAVTLWATSLTLRAVAVVALALWLGRYVPSSAIADGVNELCWHGHLPVVGLHVVISGHGATHVVAMLPAALVVVSLAITALGVKRVAVATRDAIAASRVGPGPRDSVVIRTDQVFLAAAGLGHPRVIVSTGALRELDEHELDAAMDHERGHIRRGHRFVLLYASACRAVGRIVPGAARAESELAFHLERDADRWALRRHDRRMLARAILKAARSATAFPRTIGEAAPDRVLAPLTGTGGLVVRVGELLEAPPSSRSHDRTLRLVASAAAAVTCVLVAWTADSAAHAIVKLTTHAWLLC